MDRAKHVFVAPPCSPPELEAPVVVPHPNSLKIAVADLVQVDRLFATRVLARVLDSQRAMEGETLNVHHLETAIVTAGQENHALDHEPGLVGERLERG